MDRTQFKQLVQEVQHSCSASDRITAAEIDLMFKVPYSRRLFDCQYPFTILASHQICLGIRTVSVSLSRIFTLWL